MLKAAGLVLGCGSPWRGDDALGLVAVERLRRRWEKDSRRTGRLDAPLGSAVERSEVEFARAPLDAFEIVDRLQRRPFGLLLDACEAGLQPGTVATWVWRGQADVTPATSSLHGWDIGKTLALAQALGCPLRTPLLIMGIQVDRRHLWGEGLSPAVEQALPQLVERAIVVLASWVRGDAGIGWDEARVRGWASSLGQRWSGSSEGSRTDA